MDYQVDVATLQHSDKCCYWDNEEFCDCGAIDYEKLKQCEAKLAEVEQERDRLAAECDRLGEKLDHYIRKGIAAQEENKRLEELNELYVKQNGDNADDFVVLRDQSRKHFERITELETALTSAQQSAQEQFMGKRKKTMTNAAAEQRKKAAAMPRKRKACNPTNEMI